MKRLFDFGMSLVGLAVLFPVLLLVALGVVVDSGWPVLFVQKRVGRGGVLFSMYKFRSMTVMREAAIGSFNAGDSSRVTRVGGWLRRTKIDELPQLWNVLIGDMSLVGPRPEVLKWVKVYPGRWKLVHSVRPGITDNASIEFRNEEALLAASDDPEATYKEVVLPQKLALYESYVRSHSFWGDIQIIFKTLFPI
jgi:lipopolysaccharide/colanic/teichoic acid biosynthesis glycosyltransferase